MAKRLYVVVRGDLKPGLQAAQACHAVQCWECENPGTKQTLGTLIVLSVTCKHELNMLAEELEIEGLSLTRWWEPDLDNELTVFAVRLGKKKWYLLEHLPLALQ